MEKEKRIVARLFVSFGSELEIEDDYFDVYLWMREDKSWCKRNYKYHKDSLIGMLQNPETARKVLATFLIRRDGEEWFKFW